MIETVVREGAAAAEIAQEATRINADLLVIGTHGRSGFERLLLGSVAEKVLRKATCPVMTVPGRLPDAGPADPVLFKRILCPVDFSQSSLHALKYATSMAQEADGQLTVLHVVEHEFGSKTEMPGAYESGMTMGEFLKEREDAMRRRLQDIAAGAPEFCSVKSVSAHGKPWREVLRAAMSPRTFSDSCEGMPVDRRPPDGCARIFRDDPWHQPCAPEMRRSLWWCC